MLRVFWHTAILGFLTIVTQVGGVAWIVALFFRRRLLVFLVAYAGISLAVTQIAPQFGRVPIRCLGDGPLQVQSPMYCALNRTYVTPELAAVLQDTAERVAARYPGTITLMLDGSFPFLDGFPLLPHLSHDDGEKADLAFYYADDTGYLPGTAASPIGYFAFEDGPTDCPTRWADMRWDLAWLQPLWPDYSLDASRNRTVLEVMAADPRVGKVFVEPHLLNRWGVADPKIRFQGCRAARHDDHIHMQLR